MVSSRRFCVPLKDCRTTADRFEPRIPRVTEAPEGLKLSVVIPVYNERFLVRELVERVLAVAVPEIREMELLIVDDGSTDGSREILRQLAALHPDRIRYFEQEKNQGKGAALRRGIAAATGDITLFQDADL